MEQLLPFIIQAAAGAVGGNVVGMLRGQSGFGPLINSILGALGGVGAAQGAAAGGLLEQLLALVGGNENVASGALGGLGGLVLPLIASFFKKTAA